MTLFEYSLLAFVSLFAIVSPVSTAALFLAMTPDNTRQERTKMAKLACVVVALVLIGFSLIGELVLRTFGITVAAFQTAGGILLLLIALDMLQAKESSRKISREESQAGTEKDDIAITPLAVPLLAGPGAISTSIVLSSQAQDWTHRGALCLAIALVSVLTYWILNIAGASAGWLNPLFLRVTTRLMGLLLGALAVQFVFNGLGEANLF